MPGAAQAASPLLGSHRGRIGLVLATAAFLLLLGAWTYRAVDGSLRELRADSLRGLLDAQINALGVWLDEELRDAERIARDPGVREAAARLVELAAREATTHTELCSGAARATLEKAIQPLLRDVGGGTLNVVDRTGRLLLTRFPDYCGRLVHPVNFRPLLEGVFDGASKFLGPIRDADRIDAPPRLREGGPLTWFEVPIRDPRAQVIAALGIAEPAEGRFSAILAAARPGDSGEVFAFDARGEVLSRSRFPGSPQALRVPGTDTPTRLAVEAIASRSPQGGVLLDAYRNHRDVDTVGAWRWLPELGLGIAIEMGAAEAYEPLRYLSIAFAAVFGALVIAVLAALGSGFSALALIRRIGETQKLGAYVLGRRIGEGGMANVYLARHALLKRPTAIKLLKPHRATDEMIARFAREVQLASQLSHPNTVEIFDYGRTRDGQFYYAMEYLDGLTVTELIARSGPPGAAIPVSRTVYILRQLCAGLAEAHGKKLVHRDIKPENIMVCRRGGEYDVVKILDFGLVKHLSGEYSRDLTRDLRILGTPLYMAPERLRNRGDVDARADIYALGAVAFLMLTGRKLFESSDDLELTSRVLNEEPPRPSAVAPQSIPFELDVIIVACLEKRREDRPQRIGDLLEAFEALATDHRWTQREAEEWWARVPAADVN